MKNFTKIVAISTVTLGLGAVGVTMPTLFADSIVAQAAETAGYPHVKDSIGSAGELNFDDEWYSGDLSTTAEAAGINLDNAMSASDFLVGTSNDYKAGAAGITEQDVINAYAGYASAVNAVIDQLGTNEPSTTDPTTPDNPGETTEPTTPDNPGETTEPTNPDTNTETTEPTDTTKPSDETPPAQSTTSDSTTGTTSTNNNAVDNTEKTGSSTTYTKADSTQQPSGKTTEAKDAETSKGVAKTGVADIPTATIGIGILGSLGLFIKRKFFA